MSKQSDGSSSSSSGYKNYVAVGRMAAILRSVDNFVIVDDCQVDCSMRLFLPLSITYHDFTDWNVNHT